MAYRAYRGHQQKQKTSRVTEVTHSEHNGQPIITLPSGSRFGLTFGLKKATAILQHIEAIQEFVATDGRGPVADTDCMVSEFMGRKVISQPYGRRYGFTASLREARVYLQYIEELRSFTGFH